MDRRELLKMITVLTGSAFIGGELLLTGCKNEPTMGGAVFNADDVAFWMKWQIPFFRQQKAPALKRQKWVSL